MSGSNFLVDAAQPQHQTSRHQQNWECFEPETRISPIVAEAEKDRLKMKRERRPCPFRHYDVMTGMSDGNLGHGLRVNARIAPKDVAHDLFVTADIHL